jgi:hypothetical protein
MLVYLVKHCFPDTPDKVTDFMVSRKNFLVALALENLTATKFAAQLGVSKSFLSNCLAGRKKSRRVQNEVEKFISESLRRHGVKRKTLENE